MQQCKWAKVKVFLLFIKASLSTLELAALSSTKFSTKTGVKKINPAVEDTHKLNEKLSRALYALGVTPKSLGGNVAAKPKQDPHDALEAVLNGDMTEEEAEECCK